MNNEPFQDLIIDQDDVLAKTIITQKQFNLDSLSYNYSNKYKLQKVNSKAKSLNLKINNLPCVMNGNQLRKVTQIQYGDKKYFIQDIYILSNSSSSQISSKKDSKIQNSINQSQNYENSSKDSQKYISRKCCLFRKPKGKDGQGKRNTKNVAKNFCKAFLNYLQKEKKHKMDREKIENCIQKVKGLIGHKKYYNNNVIWKIIESNVCKQYFKQFLEMHAKDWIQRSKMQYKDVHFEAIKIYLQLYQKKTFLSGDQEEQDQLSDMSQSK